MGFRVGQRVRIVGGPLGRVVAVVRGGLVHVRFEEPDKFGNLSGHFLAEALRPVRK